MTQHSCSFYLSSNGEQFVRITFEPNLTRIQKYSTVALKLVFLMYFSLKGNHLHFIAGRQKCSNTTNAENILNLHSNYLLLFLCTQGSMSLTHTQRDDTNV